MLPAAELVVHQKGRPEEEVSIRVGFDGRVEVSIRFREHVIVHLGVG